VFVFSFRLHICFFYFWHGKHLHGLEVKLCKLNLHLNSCLLFLFCTLHRVNLWFTFPVLLFVKNTYIIRTICIAVQFSTSVTNSWCQQPIRREGLFWLTVSELFFGLQGRSTWWSRAVHVIMVGTQRKRTASQYPLQGHTPNALTSFLRPYRRKVPPPTWH
jgi:hypothetical protein